MYLSIVIPVYRAQETLRDLCRRLLLVLPTCAQRYEILFVEDAGGDASWAVIVELAATNAEVRAIRFSRNFGQHSALLCGIRDARGDIVVTLDDDLQNPPEDIPRLIAELESGYEVVYGTPSAEKHGLLRNLASRITKWTLQEAMGAETAGKVSAFRAFRTDLREGFSDYRSPTVNIDVLLTWVAARFSSVEVRHDARQAGQSGYTLRTLIAHAFNMVTGFSTLPLQLASVIGFMFTFFGFAVLAHVIYQYITTGVVVAGFYFLASIIAIFSGAQLFSVGIIGEYLARMHFRSMERPPYVVRERITGEKSRFP